MAPTTVVLLVFFLLPAWVVPCHTYLQLMKLPSSIWSPNSSQTTGRLPRQAVAFCFGNLASLFTTSLIWRKEGSLDKKADGWDGLDLSGFLVHDSHSDWR